MRLLSSSDSSSKLTNPKAWTLARLFCSIAVFYVPRHIHHMRLLCFPFLFSLRASNSTTTTTTTTHPSSTSTSATVFSFQSSHCPFPVVNLVSRFCNSLVVGADVCSECRIALAQVRLSHYPLPYAFRDIVTDDLRSPQAVVNSYVSFVALIIVSACCACFFSRVFTCTTIYRPLSRTPCALPLLRIPS